MDSDPGIQPGEPREADLRVQAMTRELAPSVNRVRAERADSLPYEFRLTRWMVAWILALTFAAFPLLAGIVEVDVNDVNPKYPPAVFRGGVLILPNVHEIISVDRSVTVSLCGVRLFCLTSTIPCYEKRGAIRSYWGPAGPAVDQWLWKGAVAACFGVAGWCLGWVCWGLIPRSRFGLVGDS